MMRMITVLSSLSSAIVEGATTTSNQQQEIYYNWNKANETQCSADHIIEKDLDEDTIKKDCENEKYENLLMKIQCRGRARRRSCKGACAIESKCNAVSLVETQYIMGNDPPENSWRCVLCFDKFNLSDQVKWVTFEKTTTTRHPSKIYRWNRANKTQCSADDIIEKDLDEDNIKKDCENEKYKRHGWWMEKRCRGKAMRRSCKGACAIESKCNAVSLVKPRYIMGNNPPENSWRCVLCLDKVTLSDQVEWVTFGKGEIRNN